ncbi:hypothetical protein DPMN_099147 [Dreissena polymorpha]|uniref:Uncharacterized protein n=1 Tax=Dreissena polymorpha TaxID=45954 RepID=A0A9D4LGK4_DREPO|nr:hypothetical protein DPMN_099147 [Dreissena polymorpha]
MDRGSRNVRLQHPLSEGEEQQRCGRTKSYFTIGHRRLMYICRGQHSDLPNLGFARKWATFE